jgi:rhomboid protease GluP
VINEPTEEQLAHSKFSDAFFARRAWLCYVLFGLNIFIFALMVLASKNRANMFTSGTDFPILLNFGAKLNALIFQQTEWFRVVTSIFLHIGVLHLALNSYMLWNVGPTIERLYGASRFFIIYLFSGITGGIGSVFSDYYFKSDGVGAGASGALFGLVGVSLAVSYRYRRELPEGFRKVLGPGMIQVVAINLIYGFMSNASANRGHLIGNAAHIFGLLGGGVLGLTIPILEPDEKEKSQNSKFAISLCVMIIAYCFVRAFLARPYPSYSR